MGLRLIKDDERLVYEIDDEARIYYRRLPNRKRGEIIDRHTKRGTTNWVGATLEMLEHAVIGWEGFYEMNGDDKRVDVPYSLDKVRWIPDDEQTNLFDLLGENTGSVEAKNSGTTASSNTTTKASRAGSAAAKP